jgi:hypothetical protein
MTAIVVGFFLGLGASVLLMVEWRYGFLAAQWAKLRARWPWLPG